MKASKQKSHKLARVACELPEEMAKVASQGLKIRDVMVSLISEYLKEK